MSAEVLEMADISVDLAESDVWSCLGSPGRVVPGLAGEVSRSIALSEELCVPRGLYARLEVAEIARKSVSLAGGPTLECAFISHLFEGASEPVFLVVTVGEALETKVSDLFAAGESVDAVVLDAVGSGSIMGAFSHALTRVWQETTDRGWVTGTCLRPGQSYWDITGQQDVFHVVPGEQIGVSLLDSSFMRPQKSQSAVVPIGPEMKVHGDPKESYCRYCQATRCPMRQEPQVSLAG
jgi:hypothetical protein